VSEPRDDAAHDAADGDAGGHPSMEALGDYLRSQRRLAKLTLRELSDLTKVSNPYLSQLERGLHQPSVQVLTSIAKALNVSADALFARAAGNTGDEPAEAAPPDTETAIRLDPRLSESQKEALLAVYRSYRDAAE
jgi:transcriptional regulator with XRE-family HTH domain